MTANQLGLNNGSWLVLDCGKYPSEKNCKLVLMAPEDHKNDLLNAAAAHAVQFHKHTDNAEFRSQITQMMEKVTL